MPKGYHARRQITEYGESAAAILVGLGCSKAQ